MISIVAVLHVYLPDFYLRPLPPELTAMSPDELAGHLTTAWRVIGVVTLLNNLGIWFVKANFMLLFYRLGNAITAYATLWWVAAVVNVACAAVVIVACAAVQMGIVPYDCAGIAGEMASMQAHCATKLGYIYSVFKASAAINVASDFISELLHPTIQSCKCE